MQPNVPALPPEQLPFVVVGFLLGTVCGSAVGALIGALFLQLAARWTASLDLSYGTAYLIVFISAIVNQFISLIVELMLLQAGADPGTQILARLATMPIGVLVIAGVISAQLDLSFGDSVVMAFVFCLIGLVLALALGCVIFILYIGMARAAPLAGLVAMGGG